jgi:peptidoglycan glycosyltransferase
MLSAAVANDGRLFKPYLVQSELRPNLSVLDRTQPQQMSQVLDPDADLNLVSMMEGVITSPEGTGGAADLTTEFNGIVKVGGKTGTADVGQTSASKIQPDAWFTGFALEQGQPKIAVAVLLEHGGVTGNEGEATGGKAAAPIAKQVMEAYLKSVGVK